MKEVMMKFGGRWEHWKRKILKDHYGINFGDAGIMWFKCLLKKIQVAEKMPVEHYSTYP